jgi:hypothetical protein
MKQIYAELARIQQELKAPKNMYNKFGNYNYRNAEGILEAVKPLLNGYALIINDEPVTVGDRYYIKATVALTNGEESVSATAYAREDEVKKGMDGCQITGACSSYARKYALNALLMIDDSKDSDSDELSPKNPKNTPEPIKKDAPATVTTAATIPNQELSPVMKYIADVMKDMREMRGVDHKENKRIFLAQRDALVKKKLAPDKRLDQYTMEEAQALVDAMYNCFDPTGTELKTE